MSVSPELEAMTAALAGELAAKYGIHVSHPYDLARAALKAIREPSDRAIHSAFVAMNNTPSGTWKAMKATGGLPPAAIFKAKMIPRWQAMIDHILADEGSR